MLKRIALAVMASSLLFACGGEESSGDGECVLDEAAVCAGKQCGNVSAQDSCGEMKTVSCGTCGDGTTCQANMCISSVQPTCDLTDEEKAAKCEGKCGTISVQNNCEVMIELDCGTDICGDGQVCHATENRCMDESECAMSDDEKLAYCAGNVCGAAKVQDHCGNSDYVDCADASAPVNPMTDFANAYDAETNTYEGQLFIWDDNYYTAVVDGPAVYDPELDEEIAPSILIVFKKDIDAGTHELAPVTIGSDSSFQFTKSVHLLILNNSDPGYYYYTTATGSVTISEDFGTYELHGVHLSDMLDPSCYSAKMDFTMVIPPRDCSEIDPLKDFEIAKDENGNYVGDIWEWDDAGEYYAFLAEGPMVDGEDMSPYFAGVIIKSTLDYGTYDLTPVTLTENSFECTGDACLLIASNADDYYYYTATAGTVTISENGDSGLMFSVTADGFSDMLDPSCLIPGASFNIVYEAAPVDCSTLNNPMDAFTADENGEYTGAKDTDDANWTVVYLEGMDSDGNYVLFNLEYKNTLSLDTPISIKTFDDENNCQGDACVALMGAVLNAEQTDIDGLVYWYDAISENATLTITNDSTKYTISSPGFVDYYTDCPLTLESIVINIPTTPAE